MAENFSAFDYKTQEEVFTIIKHLTSVLSTTGMQLVEVLSPSNLLTQLHGPKEVIPTETVRFYYLPVNEPLADADDIPDRHGCCCQWITRSAKLTQCGSDQEFGNTFDDYAAEVSS
jgi:hypothetical protein